MNTHWIRVFDTASAQWVSLNTNYIVSHGRFAANGFAVRMTNATTFLLTTAQYKRLLKHLSK